MNILITSEASKTEYISELRGLLEKKWGKFSDFMEEKDGLIAPAPIIALENNILLGGLVFSLWPNPETGEICIWINGVIVKPEYQKQGVATKLIQKATQTNSLLFVNTDIENLYKKIGWSITGVGDSGTILKYINNDNKDYKGHNI